MIVYTFSNSNHVLGLTPPMTSKANPSVLPMRSLAVDPMTFECYIKLIYKISINSGGCAKFGQPARCLTCATQWVKKFTRLPMVMV